MTKQKEADSNGKTIGITAKLLGSILLPLILILFCVGAFLSGRVASIVETHVAEEMKAQTNAAVTEVEAYFKPYEYHSDALANSANTRRLLQESSLTGRRLEECSVYEEALKEMDVLKQKDGNILNYWVSGKNAANWPSLTVM